MDHLERIIHEQADHRRVVNHSERDGNVYQVWSQNGEQKIRIQIGIKSDGTPWLTPWLHTEDHRGSHRHEEKYHKGQNVRVTALAGDFRQATVTPHSENTDHPPPDHGDDANHTTQNDTLRERHGPDFQELWLAKDTTQPGQGGQKYTDPDNDSVLLVRIGAKPQQSQPKNAAWDGPPTYGGKPKPTYLVKTKPGSSPQQIQHSVDDKHKVTMLEGQGIDHTTQNNLTHNVTQNWTAAIAQGNISHTASQGSITHTAGTTMSRSAGSSISDQAPAIGHNGNTSVTGTLGVSQVVTALSYGTLSDLRFKQNVQLAGDAWKSLLAVNVYECEFVGAPRKRHTLMAHEVCALLPELVYEVEHEGEQALMIDLPGVLALLVKAVQQLAAKQGG